MSEEYLKKKTADENLQSTDHAFVLYVKAHPVLAHELMSGEPQFDHYYKPSNRQKQYELLYVGGGMLGVDYAASRMF